MQQVGCSWEYQRCCVGPYRKSRHLLRTHLHIDVIEAKIMLNVLQALWLAGADVREMDATEILNWDTWGQEKVIVA